MENKNYISRKRYIDKLKLFIDKPVIKVLTGMRRVGKSTLLTMIRDEILKNIPDENKIYLNFESIELFKINEAGKLIEYLKPLLKKDERQYIFYDEIQLVKNWEQVVNGLRLNDNYDIYITGSNSTLISGDLATLLAGRYVEFEIQPFTFGNGLSSKYYFSVHNLLFLFIAIFFHETNPMSIGTFTRWMPKNRRFRGKFQYFRYLDICFIPFEY